MSNIGPNFNSPRQPLPNSQARPAAGAQEAGPTQPQPQAYAAEPAALPAALLMGRDGRLALSPLLAFENGLNAQQALLLLRNLLQMPKEVTRLLALLANEDGADVREILRKLVSEDVNIPLEALQDLLVKQGEKSQDKLLKLMQSSQMNMTGSGGQMGELMSQLTEMVAKIKQSPADALQTALTLYLPFNPNLPPQRFSLYFEPLEDDESGKDDNTQLIIFIETITLGQFRVSIAKTPDTRLKVHVTHEPAAEPTRESLSQKIREALANEGLPGADLDFENAPALNPVTAHPAQSSGSSAHSDNGALNPSAGIEARSAEKETADVSEGYPAKPATGGRQSVGIHPSGGVSITVIQAAYVLIRVIFELDNRNTLNGQRGQLAPKENPSDV